MKHQQDMQRRKRVVRLGLLATGVALARWLTARTTEMTRERMPRNRWMMVTINCPPERLSTRADLPEPIARLGDSVDIKICPAPGDRGTELGARLHETAPARTRAMASRLSIDDQRRTVRRALRHAKSLIETGEVMRTDWPPSKFPTPTGRLLEFAGRRGSGGGRL